MSKKQEVNAAAMRRRMTVPEKRLGKVLLARLPEARFRAQVPIGPHIADFASWRHRLVVEVDGPHHGFGDADLLRDADLAARGWRVARYWNHEVIRDPEAVLADVARKCGLTPTYNRIKRP